MGDNLHLPDRVLQALNNNGDIEAVESDGVLTVKWRWKDAVQLGFTSITKETAEYRYAVVLDYEHKTFYGYDTDESTSAGLDRKGIISLRGRSFVGHEVKLHRELALSTDNGIRDWGYSTKRVHDAVRDVLEAEGWGYREPGVTWVSLGGSSRLTYCAIGAVFFLAGLLFLVPAVLEGAWPMGLFTALFALTGFWAVLAGTGRRVVPVFSVRICIILTLGITVGAFVLAFLVAGALMLFSGSC